MESELDRQWLRETLPEWATAIFRAEDAEKWALHTKEFQEALETLHQNFSRHSHNLDAVSVTKLKVLLVFSRFSYFLRILQGLQHKNGEILLHILQSALPHPGGDVINNTIAVRARYVMALGVCSRVFSEERIQQVLAALGREAL